MKRFAARMICGILIILIPGQFVFAQSLPEDINIVTSFYEIVSEVESIAYDCDPNDYSPYIGRLDSLLRTESEPLLYKQISSYRDRVQMSKDQRISDIETDKILAQQAEADRIAREEQEWIEEQEDIWYQQQLEAEYAMEEFGWMMEDFLYEIFLPVILPLGLGAIVYFALMADDSESDY